MSSRQMTQYLATASQFKTDKLLSKVTFKLPSAYIKIELEDEESRFLNFRRMVGTRLVEVFGVGTEWIETGQMTIYDNR